MVRSYSGAVCGNERVKGAAIELLTRYAKNKLKYAHDCALQLPMLDIINAGRIIGVDIDQDTGKAVRVRVQTRLSGNTVGVFAFTPAESGEHLLCNMTSIRDIYV